MERRPTKILIVTYVFPPFAAVGVYRILKFCKYLVDFGFAPAILTPSRPNTMARDENLLDQVSPNLPVYHTLSIDPFRIRRGSLGKPMIPDPGGNLEPAESTPARPPARSLKNFVKLQLSVPDRTMLWSWSGLWQGVRAVKKEKADIILSSSPPPSVHLLASRLARLTGRPHVVDFRDLWTQNTSYAERQLPDNLERRDRQYEIQVLRRAAGITVNTSTFKTQLLQKNPFLAEDRIEVINNGVDPDDFRDFIATPRTNDRFTILYMGSLYGKHRDPEFFLAAVRRWLDQDNRLRSGIRIRFIGNWTPEYVGLIEKYDLTGVVERSGWLPQGEALAETFAADQLLLIQGFDPALAAAIPRKLYEYMITNKPILAFAPPGEIPDIIARYRCGVYLSEKSPEPIIDALSKNYANWQAAKNQSSPPRPSLRTMPELETATQVEKLARFLRSLN